MERFDFKVDGSSDVELSIHVARYALTQSLCPAKRVLDVACGQGFGSWLMAERWGAKSVVGVDISTAAIEHAQSTFPSEKIQYICSSAEDLGALQLEPFDLIVSLETIEHVQDVEAFLDGVSSLLSTDGNFICTAPNDAWYYGPGKTRNPWHLRTYTLSSFKELMSSRFPSCRFFLGTPAHGFVNVEESILERTSNTPEQQVKSLVVSPMSVAPPSIDSDISHANVAYFAALVGPGDLAASGSVYPASLDQNFSVNSNFPRTVEGKLRICFVADLKGWAFDNIVQNISRYLKDCCEIDVLYVAEYEDFGELHRKLFGVGRAYDVIHFFWHPVFASLFDPEVLFSATRDLSSQGRDYFFWDIAQTCKTTSVYDHLFLDDSESDVRQRRYLSLADAYSVASPSLQTIYSNMEFMSSPEALITDGIDLETFAPKNIERLSRTSGTFRIGWAGNSVWGPPEQDHKGLRTVINPLIDELVSEGYKVEGVFCDRNVEWRPREEMPDFYNSIDIYVCASLNEGTPNPVLEAMACGVPVLSTDVGILSQAFGPLQSQFLVADRESREFGLKLRQLLEDADLRRRLSEENLESIQAWNWESRANCWLEFFTTAMKARESSYSKLQQKVVLSELWSSAQQNSVQLESKDLEISQLLNQLEAQKTRTNLPKSRHSIGLRERLGHSFSHFLDFSHFIFLSLLPKRQRLSWCEANCLPACYIDFDWWSYLRSYPDLRQAKIYRAPEAARHWLSVGRTEPRVLKRHPITNVTEKLSALRRAPVSNGKRIPISIVTRTEKSHEVSSALKHSLSSQTFQDFCHLVVNPEYQNGAYIDYYTKEEVKRRSLNSLRNSFWLSDSVYFNILLSKLGDTWILFLNDGEQLSKPDSLEILIRNANDTNEVLLWNIGGADSRRESSESEEETQLDPIDTSGFLVHSRHLNHILFDGYPEESRRLLRRLLGRLRHRWIDSESSGTTITMLT